MNIIYYTLLTVFRKTFQKIQWFNSDDEARIGYTWNHPHELLTHKLSDTWFDMSLRSLSPQNISWWSLLKVLTYMLQVPCSYIIFKLYSLLFIYLWAEKVQKDGWYNWLISLSCNFYPVNINDINIDKSINTNIANTETPIIFTKDSISSWKIWIKYEFMSLIVKKVKIQENRWF